MMIAEIPVHECFGVGRTQHPKQVVCRSCSVKLLVTAAMAQKAWQEYSHKQYE